MYMNIVNLLKNNKKKSILISVFVIITVILMLLVWPFNILKVDGSYEKYDSETTISYLTLTENRSIRQFFVSPSNYLQYVELELGDIKHKNDNGFLTIRVLDGSKKEIITKDILYDDLLQNMKNVLYLNCNLEEGKKYILSISASSESYVSVGRIQNKDSLSEICGNCYYNSKKIKGGLAANYRFEKDFNTMQTFVFWCLCVLLCCVFILFVCKLRVKNVLKYIKETKVLGQTWVILLLVSVFNLNAILSDNIKELPPIKAMLPVVLLWVITILLGFFIVLKVKKHIEWLDIKKVFRKNKWLILVIVVSALVRIPMLDTMQRWDAGEYYYRLGTACQNYEFTFKSFFDNFRLCTHSNLGFSFFMGIAEFLTPRNQIGVLCWNLILTVCVIVCIYILLKKYWLRSSDAIVALTTLVISFTPIFLGTFAYFNVDYFLLIAFIFLVYFEYQKQYILMGFFAIILSQTKETGVIILAGYLGSKIIIDFCVSKGSVFKKIISVLKSPHFWSACIAAVLYCMQIIALGGISEWKQNSNMTESSVLWSNDGFNCFGFQPAYVLYKLKQFFVLNFSWILVILFITSIIILLWKQRKEKNQFKGIASLSFALIGFVAFSILYITYTLSRYNIFFNVVFGIVVLCVYYHATERLICKKIYTGTIGILGVLMLIQSFWNIDIVSSKVFQTVSIGENDLLFTSYNHEYYGDALVTNYQYHWLDEAYNKLLDEVEYSSDQYVLIPETQYFGSHLEGNPNVYTVGWDANSKKRVMLNEKQGNSQPIICTTEYSLFTQYPFKVYPYEQAIPISQKSVLYFMPYYNVDEDIYVDMYESLCYVSEQQTIHYYGGRLSYYEMVKKEEYEGFSLEECIVDESQFKNANTVKRNDLMDFMENVGWNWQEVLDYYNYLNCKNAEVVEYEKMPDTVSEYDEIKMSAVAYDEKGEYIPFSYIGNNILNQAQRYYVGNGAMFNEVDQALLGCKVGETVTVSMEVPTDYHDLQPYLGQEIQVIITPTEITGRIDIQSLSEEEKEENFKKAFNVVWDYYYNEVVQELALMTVDEKILYDEKELEQIQKDVDAYFEKYLISSSIYEEEFLDKYLKMSNAEYAEAKEQLVENVYKKQYYISFFENMQAQMKKQLRQEGLKQYVDN